MGIEKTKGRKQCVTGLNQQNPQGPVGGDMGLRASLASFAACSLGTGEMEGSERWFQEGDGGKQFLFRK